MNISCFPLFPEHERLHTLALFEVLHAQCAKARLLFHYILKASLCSHFLFYFHHRATIH